MTDEGKKLEYLDFREIFVKEQEMVKELKSLKGLLEEELNMLRTQFKGVLR